MHRARAQPRAPSVFKTRVVGTTIVKDGIRPVVCSSKTHESTFITKTELKLANQENL